MKIPYRQLDCQVLTDDTKRQLVDYVMSHPELLSDFYRNDNNKIVHPTGPGQTHALSTGLKRMHVECVQHIISTDIEKFKSTLRIKVRSRGTILYTEPGAKLKIHKDTQINYRQCSIIVPLYPLNNDYSPTLFYPEWPNTDVVVRLEGNQCPALIDLQTYHNVENNSVHPRFNFQLSYGSSNTFDALSALMDSGSFFIK